MKKVNLLELIEKVKKPWQIMDVVSINKTALRIAKIEGAYQWHTHQKEDEFFLVIKGKIFIDTNKDGTIELDEMESYLVEKGLRHRSRSEKPAWVLLVEPTETKTLGE
ncbi:MAG: cupin domain-containing protein [Candidatus Aminicenantes bacterium]|nr:cupin domain-containing protein [Candidatus Aminicenantes bacterium]